MQNDNPAASSPIPDTEDLSLAEDLRLLAEEGKVLAQAELAFQKARARYAASQARKIVVLIAATLVLAFFAAMAFVLGAVLTLAPLITPLGATLLVTLALLLLAALCAMRVRTSLRGARRVLSDTPREER